MEGVEEGVRTLAAAPGSFCFLFFKRPWQRGWRSLEGLVEGVPQHRDRTGTRGKVTSEDLSSEGLGLARGLRPDGDAGTAVWKSPEASLKEGGSLRPQEAPQYMPTNLASPKATPRRRAAASLDVAPPGHLGMRPGPAFHVRPKPGRWSSRCSPTAVD